MKCAPPPRQAIHDDTHLQITPAHALHHNDLTPRLNMTSNEFDSPAKSLKMWYTAPCELVLSFSMADDMPDDFATKNVQIFVVEFTQPLSREPNASADAVYAAHN